MIFWVLYGAGMAIAAAAVYDGYVNGYVPLWQLVVLAVAVPAGPALGWWITR